MPCPTSSVLERCFVPVMPWHDRGKQGFYRAQERYRARAGILSACFEADVPGSGMGKPEGMWFFAPIVTTP